MQADMAIKKYPPKCARAHLYESMTHTCTRVSVRNGARTRFRLASLPDYPQVPFARHRNADAKLARLPQNADLAQIPLHTRVNLLSARRRRKGALRRGLLRLIEPLQ